MNVKQPRLQIPPALSSFCDKENPNTSSLNMHRFYFSCEDIESFLYGRNELNAVDLNETNSTPPHLADQNHCKLPKF